VEPLDLFLVDNLGETRLAVENDFGLLDGAFDGTLALEDLCKFLKLGRTLVYL
jgi:hypothetical protein